MDHFQGIAVRTVRGICILMARASCSGHGGSAPSLRGPEDALGMAGLPAFRVQELMPAATSTSTAAAETPLPFVAACTALE